MLVTRFFNGSDYGYAIALQEDAKIVVVGAVIGDDARTDFGLLRLNADGSRDPSFNGDGIVQHDIAGYNDDASARAVAIQSDGKIVVAGYVSGYVSGTFVTRFAVARYHADGSRDTSFGTGGVVTTAIGASRDSAYGLVIQPDGKIVVAGDSLNYATGYDFALARYNGDGTLDTSFSGDGKLTTSFNTQTDRVYAVSLQADGKILAAGFTRVGTQFDFALARYTSDGTLDTSFDSDGKVTTAVTTANDEARAMAIQPDGKIVVAGYVTSSSNVTDFTLLRYQTNGALDTAFGTAGIVTTPVGTGSSRAHGVLLQRDGKIVVAGQAASTSALLRYTTSGSLDMDFGNDGIVLTQASWSPGNAEPAHGVAIQTDDKIVTAGYAVGGGSGPDFAVVRYTVTGSLDVDFDGDGIARTPVGTGKEFCYALAVQPDGKIVAAGSSRTSNSNGGDDQFVVARYRADGSLDTDFHSRGFLVESVYAQDHALDVAIQPDGKIVAAGYTSTAAQSDIAVARFNPSSGTDNTFNTYGHRTISIGSGYDVATAVAIQPDGKILLAGYTGNGLNDDIVLLRLLTNGASDTSFGSGGVITVALGSGDDRAEGMALQPDGKIVLAGQASDGANTDFVLLRFNADGTPDPAFGMDGKVLVDFGSADAEAYEVAIQPDGRIIAAGYYHDYNPPMLQFAVARLEANGTLDTTFGNDGMALVDTGGITGYGMGMALQADGRIVMAGVADNVSTVAQFALARINPDGAPDTTFGNDGQLTTAIGSEYSAAHAVVVQPDGKIVAGGYSMTAGTSNFVLARFDGGTPLAVLLNYFEATAAHGAVRLAWETASEIDNRGFNLYRGVSSDGWDRQLNEFLIPSQGQGSPVGFEYSWYDNDDLIDGMTYYYWLEDMDLTGVTTLHGPVSATVVTPTAVTVSELNTGKQLANAWPSWLDTLVKTAREFLAVGFSR
jgi:uncharacterized delta-60 repeat protein